MSFLPDIAFELLSTSFQNDRLAHAYLITGEEGSGKQQLACKLICLVNKIEKNDESRSAMMIALKNAYN